MRLLHLADLHLGWEPVGWPAERAAERRRRRDGVLTRAVDVALEAGARLAVVAGDLFDDFDPPAKLVEEVLAQLRRLEGSGVLPVTVPGNHDEITYGASVYRRRRSEWPGVLVTEPSPAHLTTVRLDGETVHLYGAAYVGGLTPGDRPERDFPRLEEPGWHVAVFHGALGVPVGGERVLSLDEEALAAARYHYVALGHVHAPLQRSFPAGPAVYPGSPEAMGFGDGGCGTVTLVEYDGERTEARQLPVPVQPVRDRLLDLTLVDDVAEIDAAIDALADREAVQRIRLGGALWLPELDASVLQERHAGGFFHLEVRDQADGLAPELLERWAEEPSVRGAFVGRMLGRLGADDREARARHALALRWGLAALAGGPLPAARPPTGEVGA